MERLMQQLATAARSLRYQPPNRRGAPAPRRCALTSQMEKRVLKGSSSLSSLLIVRWLCCTNVPSLNLSKLIKEEGAAKGAIADKLKSSNILFNKGLDVAKARASVVQSLLRDVVVGVKVVATKVVQTGGSGERVGVKLRNERTSKQSYKQ